jgi:alkaline phosphatase D
MMNNLSAISLALVVSMTILQTTAVAGDSNGLSSTHGVASGDVTEHSAVIWSRADGDGYMHVKIEGPKRGKKVKSVPVDASSDYTGKIVFNGLNPETEYHYQVWFNKSKNSYHARNPESGYFKTAPRASSIRSVTFAWGGDVAGQNVCRDRNEGFPLFATVNKLNLDFFVGLGDMIYADQLCEPVGRYGNDQVAGNFTKSADLHNYWAHWKYNREEENYNKLLRQTPYIAIWDDHEVVNDFGPLHDTRNSAPYKPGNHLLPLGLKAFLDYNPVAEHFRTPGRLYRNIRWGQHLELIVLDTRQYRDANLEEDDELLMKTMLGREQMNWLKQTLSNSDATWKVIVSSVPLSIPTGFPVENGRDGWANFDQNSGFEHELLALMKFMQKQKQRNLLFITTDVHFAEVFRYTPFPEDPDFKVYEGVTGPMNAGLFPNREYDRSLGAESLFFFGPEPPKAVNDYESARQWMNFGAVAIDQQGRLTLSVIDVDGKAVYRNTLHPTH